MKLRTWREREKLTLMQLSARTGKSKSAIARIETGVSDPDRDFLETIFKVTAGAVTPNDFYDLPAPDTSSAPLPVEAAPAAGATRSASPAGVPTDEADEGRAA